MKIKLLKDIPGYEAGIYNSEEILGITPNAHSVYEIIKLIEEGFAEEIKDGIDIEEIRKSRRIDLDKFYGKITIEELEWFCAYRIVKAVIEKLNGDWKWKIGQESNCFISYTLKWSFYCDNASEGIQHTILPYCRNNEISKKVISLCEPELKILFNISG